MTGAGDPARLPEWLSAGQEALDAGRYRDAADAFGHAADALPGELALHQMVANAWRLAGDVVAAREALRRGFTVARPRDAESLHALGTALLETGAPTEARLCFEEVVRLRPRDPAALGALASARRADGDPEGAWPLVQRALTISKKLPALLLTAAQVRHALGDTAGEREWLARAEKLRPQHPLQTLQRAFADLIDGPCASGWAAFEARGLPALPPGARDWHGEPIAGQSIAVVMEQGLGDLFHFVRYVRRLQARGASRVVVECPAPTLRLLQASGFDAVPVGQLPPTDWAVPLLSLPHRLGSGSDTASELVPYLRVPATAAQPTPDSAQLPPPPIAPRRVGLTYKGNPAFQATRLRDLTAADAAAILGIPDIAWVWLQLGEEIPADAAMHAPRVEIPQLYGDWLDTARLLSSLDLVISVDTAIAHLAGAMGIPLLVLLPHAPDWRWGLGSGTSEWYPSATLIRQPAPLDWAGATGALRDALSGTFPYHSAS